MNETCLPLAGELKDKLIDWRRTIHKRPETGFDLPHTTSFVNARLKEMGCEPVQIGKAGITVSIGSGSPCIILRADMDALPMREESGLPFASTNGNAHACGHDIHTTALLGAAAILKEREDTLPGTVKLMFQPNEEGIDGARDMIENGILENPRPDAAMALHVVHHKTGTAGIRPGYAGASCDTFYITIEGIGCHGAAAHQGVDPINATAHLITALQAVNSREVAPDAMLVLNICTVHGGDAPNIVPETCTISGTIRTADDEVRQFANKRLREIAEATAVTFRAKAVVEIRNGAPPMVNDPELSREISGYIDELLGEGTVWEIPAMTGSEDFSMLCAHMPCTLVWFGTGSEEEGYPYGVHHPKVTFNEEAIPQMSAVYAQCAVRWLEQRSGK